MKPWSTARRILTSIASFSLLSPNPPPVNGHERNPNDPFRPGRFGRRSRFVAPSDFDLSPPPHSVQRSGGHLPVLSVPPPRPRPRRAGAASAGNDSDLR